MLIMKIAINGEIIDTKDVYKISEINTGFAYEQNNVWWVDADKNGDISFFHIISFGAHFILCHNEDKNKVDELRNKIIKIWSENQSEIPQFNI